MIMSERSNEFELWPSRFLGNDEDSCTPSLAGWPPSTFRVTETCLEIHRRLGQTYVLDRAANSKNQVTRASIGI